MLCFCGHSASSLQAWFDPTSQKADQPSSRPLHCASVVLTTGSEMSISAPKDLYLTDYRVHSFRKLVSSLWVHLVLVNQSNIHMMNCKQRYDC
eukprot:3579940-Amphidinium_carterae.1